MIVDIKIDFAQKAIFVANGSMTGTSVDLCCSSVVSRDSVRLSCIVAVLNDLDVSAYGVGNIYLTTPYKETIWFEEG